MQKSGGWLRQPTRCNSTWVRRHLLRMGVSAISWVQYFKMVCGAAELVVEGRLACLEHDVGTSNACLQDLALLGIMG